jgi:radical SAM superfamily enzyme with C-terminal helix-hairpin-helix motif
MTIVTIIDCFIDEPACLGVPPFISPQVRAIVGATRDAGSEANYITIDQIRNGSAIPRSDIYVIMAGSAVPGKYIRAAPASRPEIERLAGSLPGKKILGGPAVLMHDLSSDLFDLLALRDPASMTFDVLEGKTPSQRWRTSEEWDRWLMLGADSVLHHPDYPMPLIAEIETYRGCVRYASGGCSFCVEPMKGEPLMRSKNSSQGYHP